MSLARELGVSRQTVSNVINRPAVVKPETRSRVLAAIQASGYRPSAAGRSLRTSRSKCFGFRLFHVGDGINGTVMDRFLHTLVEQAELFDHRITLLTASDQSAEVRALEDLSSGTRIDGCILTDTTGDDFRPRQLAAAGLPLVVFGRPWGDPDAAHFWVDIDGAAGTAAATRSLLQDGHRTIGFLGWPRGSGVGDDRRAGWRRVIEPVVREPDSWSVATVDSVRHGAEAARHLLDEGATALVCASDSLALGAFSTYRQLFRRTTTAPVIGYDDTPIAQHLGISSVSQPVEEVAAILIRHLIDVVEGRSPTPAPPVLLPPRLVLRTPWQAINPEP